MFKNMFYVSGCDIITTVVRHLWIILLVVDITYARAIVDVTPDSIIAVAGTDVRINCTVNSNESVIWETTPFGKIRSQPVYDGNNFLNHFSESGRFTLDKISRPGSHDLLISNVELNDAGSFSCIESTKQFSDLIVTDKIACIEKDRTSRRMGENEFGLPQSILAFHCSLNFTGNTRPVFCWFLNNDPMPGISTSPTADSNSTIASGELNSVVAVRKLNCAVVSVKAVINTDPGSDQCSFNSTNVHWKSEFLEIKFAALVNHPASKCPAVDSSLMCNPRCRYEQKEHDDGSYYCQTRYTLDETNYFLQVNSTRRASEYYMNKSAQAVLVIGVIIVVAVILWHFKNDIIRFCRPKFISTGTRLRRVDGQSDPTQQRASLNNGDNPDQQ